MKYWSITKIPNFIINGWLLFPMTTIMVCISDKHVWSSKDNSFKTLVQKTLFLGRFCIIQPIRSYNFPLNVGSQENDIYKSVISQKIGIKWINMIKRLLIG
jgi:hypothetical protein